MFNIGKDIENIVKESIDAFDIARKNKLSLDFKVSSSLAWFGHYFYGKTARVEEIEMNNYIVRYSFREGGVLHEYQVTYSNQHGVSGIVATHHYSKNNVQTNEITGSRLLNINSSSKPNPSDVSDIHYLKIAFQKNSSNDYRKVELKK